MGDTPGNSNAGNHPLPHDETAAANTEKQELWSDVHLEYVTPEGCTVAPGVPTKEELYLNSQPGYMNTQQSPPPSYESVIPSASQLPLTYVDFIPRPIAGTMSYDTFSGLVEQANQWLLCNQAYEAKTCESIERKVKKDGVIETETTCYHESAYGQNTYVKCLRLWLVLRQNPADPPQQLNYFTVLPDFTWKRTGGHHMLGMASMARSHMWNLPSFESFSRTVDKLNKKLQDNPIPGKVLTVETMDYKYCENWSDDVIDPEKTFYSEKGDNPKVYVFLLRIFYISGPPCHELIGLRDFKPECLSKTIDLISKPKFENFTPCLYKAGNWLYSQKGLRLTNIQHIDVNLTTGYKTVYFNPNQTEFVQIPSLESGKIGIIRAYYTIAPSPDPSPPIRLTSRLFAPCKISRANYETMSQTMQRIIAWLACTGTKVVSAQIVNMEVSPDSNSLNPEKTTRFTCGNRGHYWLSCVRVYLDGTYLEPPPYVLPPVPNVSLRPQHSDCCSLL